MGAPAPPAPLLCVVDEPISNKLKAIMYNTKPPIKLNKFRKI